MSQKDRAEGDEPLVMFEHSGLRGFRTITTIALVLGTSCVLFLIAGLITRGSLQDPVTIVFVILGAVLAAGGFYMAWKNVFAWPSITFELYKDRAVLDIAAKGETSEVPLNEDTRVEVLKADKKAPLSRNNAGVYFFRSEDGDEIMLVKGMGWKEVDLQALWDPFMWVVENTGCRCEEGSNLSIYLKQRDEG